MHHPNSDRDQKLRAENDRLIAEIHARGGSFTRLPGLDPAMENSFLKQVLDCEEAACAPLSSLFPDLDAMPAPEEMDEVHLRLPSR